MSSAPGSPTACAAGPGRDLSGTALAAVYGEERAEQVDDGPVLSPLPLTGPQERVVVRARSAPVTVVSGPPGTGKSHTVVAAALEVVNRGGSVLVATQSPHAAEVLAELLGRYPGPLPVLFGDAGSRESIAADLAAGADTGVGDRELRADRAAVRQTHDLVRAQRAAITEVLDQERLAASLPAWQPLLPGLAVDVPGAFDDVTDLARASARGWWARWRFRRRLRVRSGVPEERVAEAITAATAQRAAGRLAATGGTDLTERWAALHTAEVGLATDVGTAMRRAARSAQRWDREARRGAAALSAALRAGRNRRRELLARLDAPPLVRALPLWIGTVADVEDLLPAAPGLFDLVVIDEASHVDQVRAAPVLARARRALVVGDPRQLRFVSFVSDVDVAAVLARHGADERLDVRRVSTYDLAAGAAPATWLADHHRSVPHLIGFSARRFYQDRLTVLTRTPAAEATDAIEVIRVPPTPGVKGVNTAEVKAVLEVVATLAAAGLRGIGVISPFRAQAEAIEEALVAAYPVEQIEELGLRTGTVHAFQGSEAEVVVVSLALVPGDAPGRRRFVADPHLFNVMITRARTRLVLVTSLTSADGLLGDYLAYAAGPPPPAETAPATGWAARLGAELTRLGVTVRAGYPVGEWRVDLCAGPVGVICGVHPDGPRAHLARQRALHRLGWRLVDAFPSRWRDDPRRAALEVAALVRDTVDTGAARPAADGSAARIGP
ncbi:AAA domain-containing protein [Actinoplanes sp. ATCC 53533]|uniref:AAA domain-containing protein n=1 Tax=Actinoplanes sp. ATCC 53533 TaxID=1288362 RepID=UPI00272A4CA2|nr:AAA domain-containing protein [Actinoplanes sp. ATCC 53533]